jgi:hypothetical protein
MEDFSRSQDEEASSVGLAVLTRPVIIIANHFSAALRRSICLAGIGALCVAGAGRAVAADVKVTRAGGPQFVGAAGCKSSSCHGGAGEKRSQYLTWLQQDFHARSYAVLVNARSARMAETLGLSSAPTSSRCTICHSPFQTVAPTQLASTARTDEGVSCESCHNAAGSWLRGHTRTDWTFGIRVTAGMRDLRNFYVRANTCVACHQNIDRDLLQAGHPELNFELDGQSIAEPKHWVDVPDTGPKAWLIGQAVALRELSWALSNDSTPEPETLSKWYGLTWLLARVTAHETRLPLIDVPTDKPSHSAFITMQQRADSLARHAATASLMNDFARETIEALLGSDTEFAKTKESSDILFRRAERLVTALDRLANAVANQDANPAQTPEMRRLYEDVESRSQFQAARFANDLGNFRAKLGEHSSNPRR